MYMDSENRSCSFRLVDGNSTLNVAGIETFAKKVKLAECGVPYAAISIMGPQSGGKSTLLNHLFGTNFREMDALEGKSQTTEGIWLAKYPEVKRCTLVMDLEGSDGRERGQDGTKFEKQAALFAFAISDIVIINMWSHDVGRVQGASTPLLRIVFEAMWKLKLHDSKTTLWFVIRDRSRTPLEKHRKVMLEDMERICEEVAKGTPLTEFFEVKFADLCSYEANEEQFKKEVANLKDQLLGELDGDGREKRPASGFSFSVKDIWEKIRQNKDLDLPAQKILVATVRCEEIAKKTFDSFEGNKDWCQIQRDVKSAPVKDFGKRLTSILEELLRGYDADSMYYDEGVRAEKRRELKEKILRSVKPAHQTMLEHIHSRTLNDFKEACPEFKGEQAFRVAVRDCTRRFMTQFDELCGDAAINQANWDSSKLRAMLQRDMDAHVAKVHSDTMDEYLKHDKEKLKELLSGGVENLLVKAGDGTWQEIKKLFQQGIQTSSLFSTDIDKQTKDKNLEKLGNYGRQVLHEKSKKEAERVLTHMKHMFERFFTHTDSGDMRVWTGKEDIEEITKTARIASIKLLSIMAAIRLDDDADNISETLCSAFDDNKQSAIDSLNSESWAQVPSEKTLINPSECKKHWEKFKESSDPIVVTARKNWKAANGVSAKTIVRATGAVLAGVGAAATVSTCFATGLAPIAGPAAAGVAGTIAVGTKLGEAFLNDDSKEAKVQKKKIQNLRKLYQL